jgi:hypothetical protein
MDAGGTDYTSPKLVINLDTKVSDVLAEYGDIADVMETFGIKRVGGYSFRTSITKIITLERAARIHRVDPDEFLSTLRTAVGQTETPSGTQPSTPLGAIVAIHPSSGLTYCVPLMRARDGLPGSTRHATKQHRDEDSERKRRHVRQFHAEVPEEQHQQPGRRQREQRKRDRENEQAFQEISHCIFLQCRE